MDTNPTAAGLDASRLERLTEHFGKRYVDAGRFAGCQISVARHGELAYFRSLGRMDRERDKPMSDDAIFRIYLMTKPIASVALMMRYEHGDFQLNDPVSKFIPKWAGLKVWDGAEEVEPEQPMTVKHLLMHMSGLGGMRTPGRRGVQPGEGTPPMARPQRRTIADLDTQLTERPLVFHPGTRWMYGISTDVVGRLVEIMSGERFDTYLERHVFEPLKMADSGFRVPESEIARFAANYRRDGDGYTLSDDPENSAYTRERTYHSGAGGLASTSADYRRFSQMLLNGGELDGARILGRKTIELMTLNHLPGGVDLKRIATGRFGETGFEGIGFGLGFAVTIGQVEAEITGSRGSYYWGGAASTAFWIDPVEDLYVVFMTQLMPSGTYEIRRELRQLVYQAIVD